MIEIIFELLPRKTGITRISAPRLHFYEELKKGFYEGEQYFDYIKGNIPLFNWWLSKKASIECGKNLGSNNCQNGQ